MHLCVSSFFLQLSGGEKLGMRGNVERRLLSLSEFIYFVAEASRGRSEEKNQCERSVWKIIFVNTVGESNGEKRGRRVSRR